MPRSGNHARALTKPDFATQAGFSPRKTRFCALCGNSEWNLTAKCEELGIAYDVIGDAKQVRMGLDATADAYAVAYRI